MIPSIPPIHVLPFLLWTTYVIAVSVAVSLISIWVCLAVSFRRSVPPVDIPEQTPDERQQLLHDLAMIFKREMEEAAADSHSTRTHNPVQHQ